MNKRPAIILDLDGTLTDNSHRAHLKPCSTQGEFNNYNSRMGDDAINEWCKEIRTQFAINYDILIVTARPVKYHDMTDIWLSDNMIFYTKLFMRPIGDHRSDDLVKSDLVRREILPYYKILFAVENQKNVAAKYREMGIVTLLCEDSDDTF